MKKGLVWLFVPGGVFFLWMFLNEDTGMTLRQKMMRNAYPVINYLSRLVKSKSDSIVPKESVDPPVSVFSIPVELNDGSLITLDSFRGKKIMIVNTASDCGFTGQYEALQQLHAQRGEQLVLIGFPANDFKEQEKGNDAEIAAFCKKNYGVDFLLARKSVVVRKVGQHPLFDWLSDPRKNGWNDRAPSWNFSKYIIDESGRLAAFYESAVDPMGEEVGSVLDKR
jgi:glutathione peroxidase